MPARPITNVHERVIQAPSSAVWALLSTLGSPDDQAWRTRVPTALVLDRGLTEGSAGGHGPVRYHVERCVPGRSVVFAFDPPTGIDGTHRFELDETSSGATVLRHVLDGCPRGGMRLAWPILVRAMHDTVIEDIHDHLESTLTGRTNRPRRASRRVRAVLRLLPGRAARRVPVPGGGLLAEALPRVDASDAWTTPLLPGDPGDAATWQAMVFSAAPPWVLQLMALRDALVRPLGLRTTGDQEGRGGFPVLARTDDEVLTGVDDRHLSFRVSTRTEHGRVVVSTLVQLHNRTGRLYWSVVRRFHPVVVRSLVRRVPRPAPAPHGAR